MTNYSQIAKRCLLVAIVCLLCAFGGVFTPGVADAFTNDYITATKYYNDLNLDSVVFEFYCKASFNPIFANYYRIFKLNNDASLYTCQPQCGCFDAGLTILPNLTNGTTFTAGYTYKILLKHIHTDSSCNKATKSRIEYLIGHSLTETDTLWSYSSTSQFWGGYVAPNSNLAYYTVLPILNITFPPPGQQLAGKFNITGSYVLPIATTYNQLRITLGTEDAFGQFSFFHYAIDVAPQTGNFSVPITGIPAGNYNIAFVFEDKNNSSDYILMTGAWRQISILNSIPPELPDTGELPPSTPGQFVLSDCGAYYLNYSNYASSTPVFSILCGALKPIISITGQNLVDFSTQFSQDTAKTTGEDIGNGILTARSYLTNLNAFFGDLPVANFFLAYLSILFAVILFRLVKNIIGLFKI